MQWKVMLMKIAIYFRKINGLYNENIKLALLFA